MHSAKVKRHNYAEWIRRYLHRLITHEQAYGGEHTKVVLRYLMPSLILWACTTWIHNIHMCMQNYIMWHMRAAATKRTALRPPSTWSQVALVSKGQVYPKDIYRKIRPRTATEMNRRGSGSEDGSHPVSHKNIRRGRVMKSPCHNCMVATRYRHAVWRNRALISMFRANLQLQKSIRIP